MPAFFERTYVPAYKANGKSNKPVLKTKHIF